MKAKGSERSILKSQKWRTMDRCPLVRRESSSCEIGRSSCQTTPVVSAQTMAIYNELCSDGSSKMHSGLLSTEKLQDASSLARRFCVSHREMRARCRLTTNRPSAITQLLRIWSSDSSEL